MVAGMMPSTVKAGLVSAILSTGFHVELAIRAKVAKILSQIPAGVSITLNLPYINPRQFTSQLPLWQEMRKEGLPIESFCVAVGIPRIEEAVEIIDG
jgi:fatty acid synthase subunit alpha, fungi type